MMIPASVLPPALRCVGALHLDDGVPLLALLPFVVAAREAAAARRPTAILPDGPVLHLAPVVCEEVKDVNNKNTAALRGEEAKEPSGLSLPPQPLQYLSTYYVL